MGVSCDYILKGDVTGHNAPKPNTVGSYVGKQVILDLQEDCEDADIVMYGNSKHGSNTILDADDEWILVRIESAKGSKEKLIRLGAIQRISVLED